MNDMSNLEIFKDNIREIVNNGRNKDVIISQLSYIYDDLRDESRLIFDLIVEGKSIFNLNRYRKIHSELMECMVLLRNEIKKMKRDYEF